jgi:hypothetical protein
MIHTDILSALVLLATVIVLALALGKGKKDKKEKYCVDISGGLKTSCACSGYSEVF